MCPQFIRCKQIKHCNINDCDIIKFLREENVTIIKGDDIDIIEQNKNKKNVLMLIDPPYLQTYNSFYQNKDMNIYEYFNKNPIKKMKAKIYLVLEKNWIIDLLLKGNNVLLTTDKTYQISKKKTTHYMISNQKQLI
jgi:16S rRNA G966 N2-methylase RsmD